MPSQERVVNKRLTGAEVRQLIQADFERLITNEGLLADRVAYGRITWKVRLYLDMENPMSPHSESWVDAPDGFPLDPAGDTKSVTEIQHNVTSPNAERVRNGIPVPAEVRDFDGTTRMEEIIYPKDVVDTEADITLREVPPEER